MGESAQPIPWANWPWQRCPATTGNRESCDLLKRHDGPHTADRGMYDVVWTDHATCPDPTLTADERERRATDIAVPRRAAEIALEVLDHTTSVSGRVAQATTFRARTKLRRALQGIPASEGDK